MSTTSDITNRIITALQLSDPAWDINPGSPEYKMIDAFANQLSTANNNATLLNYSFDPNSMSGNQLDQFVSYWGIQRNQGTRATGTVTVSIGSAATTIIYIPMGTQFYVPTPTTAGNIVYFQTTSQATIQIGSTYAQIPVEATISGSSGNVLANQITGISSALVGINSVTNTTATTGGSDAETDAQLRARFLATAFRNEAGTTDQYIGTVTDNTAVSQVNVIGVNTFYTQTLPIVQELGFNEDGTLAGTFTLAFDGKATETITYSSTPATMISNIQTAIDSWISAYNILNSGQITITQNTTEGLPYQYDINFNTPNFLDEIWSINSNDITGGTLLLLNPSVYSTIPDVKFCYPIGAETVTYGPGNTIAIGALVISDGIDYIYTAAPDGPDIVFNPNGPNFLVANGLQLGFFVNVTSEYIPNSSRNWVDSEFESESINNIDIYAQGSQPFANSCETAALSGADFYDLTNSSYHDFITLEGQPPYQVSADDSDYFVPVLPQPSLTFTNVVSGDTTLTWGYPNNPTYTIAVSGPAPTSGGWYLQIATDWADLAGTFQTTNMAYNASNSDILNALAALNIGLFAVSGGPLGVSTLTISTSYYMPNTGETAANYPTITYVNNGAGDYSTSLSTTQYYPVFENDISSLENPNGGSQGSPLALAGIGITKAAYETINPDDNETTPVTVQYNYDQLISILNSAVQQVTPVNQNALVHSVDNISLLINLIVAFGQGYSSTSIQANITTALTNYFSTITFQGEVIVADILQAALSATGVQNVRLATSSDNGIFYGIQQVQVDNLTVTATSDTNLDDIFLSTNQLPTLFGVNIAQRALGSFNI